MNADAKTQWVKLIGFWDKGRFAKGGKLTDEVLHGLINAFQDQLEIPLDKRWSLMLTANGQKTEDRYPDKHLSLAPPLPPRDGV